MLSAGTIAPPFTLTNTKGENVALSDFTGQWVALWWYPEANSSGCSMQASSLDRTIAAFDEAGVVVLGASFNTVSQNDDFSCDKELHYPLLSDPEKTAGTAYQVVREPGAPFETKPFRYTYVIDPEGVIAYSEDANALPLGTYGEHLLEIVAGLKAYKQ